MFRKLDEVVDPRHTAVLVIDMQNDYCHEEGALAKQGKRVTENQAIVPALLGFLDEARKAGVPVLHVGMQLSDWNMSGPTLETRTRSKEAVEYPICQAGTWGSEFYRAVPQPGEPVVAKHRYSAFIGTDLDTMLRSKGIKTIIVTGVSTNICVQSTATDGYMLDYYTVILSDCTAGSSLDAHEAALKNFRIFFGMVATSEEVVSAWGSKSSS